MKNLLLILLLVPIGASAQKITEPVVYNDKIVDYQNGIIRAMLELSENAGSPGFTAEMCEEMRLKTLKIAKESIVGIGKMESFDGNDDLRKAALGLFQFYEDIISDEYKEVLTILYMADPSDADIEKLVGLSDKVSEEEAVLDLAFEEAQLAFAEKHNIDIQENELQEEIDDLDE